MSHDMPSAPVKEAIIQPETPVAEVPQEVAPDESRRVVDPEKAQRMAEFGDHDETVIARESAVNNGKEFSVWDNHRRAADQVEDLAGELYDMEKMVREIPDKDLARERAKTARLLDMLKNEERDRAIKRGETPAE